MRIASGLLGLGVLFAASSASPAPITFNYTINPGGTTFGTGVGAVTGGTASITFPIPGSGSSCAGLAACGVPFYSIFLVGTFGSSLFTGTLPRTYAGRPVLTPGGGFTASYYATGTSLGFLTGVVKRWSATTGGALSAYFQRAVTFGPYGPQPQSNFFVTGQEVPEPSPATLLSTAMLLLSIPAILRLRRKRR